MKESFGHKHTYDDEIEGIRLTFDLLDGQRRRRPVAGLLQLVDLDAEKDARHVVEGDVSGEGSDLDGWVHAFP